jgi:type IV secretory pathway TrbD component
MNGTMPRIAAVSVEGPSALRVTWTGGGSDRAELAGWIATGGAVLAPLKDRNRFAEARVGEYGAAVAWDDGDLAIDAVHLLELAAEQRPFGSADAARWQEALELSDGEAADFLGVGLSAWTAYKAGRPIPEAIAMLCRAAQRDPLLMQAHYRPRKAS